MVHQSKEYCWGLFTDRDRGEGLDLSDNRHTSRTGKSKHIKPYGINPAGNRRMKGLLLGMCQNVYHVYKLVVNSGTNV
jgi:hypothetical protein